ncbi:ABC transporter permease [Chitinophaga silvatica]|uniref:ABC transporter permease n=1 Tax=Chitinophaga silvatica TaxID=2282649 RepID=A0A3E1YCT3_9BACT|nr:ABC transporter permease [Chitinophaga silvatica]RFS24059.1 ABC transporter permease [Chitinophaga silvatica]
MFRNYIKIAIRHLKRHKLITGINILGLAVGMTCCIFIVLYVRDELSFDNFHTNGKNIYRVTTVSKDKNSPTQYAAATQIPVGSTIKKEVKGIKESTRVYLDTNDQIQVGDKKLSDNIAYIDPAFFKIFTFPLITGSAELKDPYTAVLSEKAAHRYFGSEPAVGKSLFVENNFHCTVIGVMKDMPENTDLHLDVMLSYATLIAQAKKDSSDLEKQWFMFQNNATYVLLEDKVDPASLKSDLNAMIDLHISKILKMLAIDFTFELQPLKNVHLHPQGDKGGVDKSSIVWIYLAIAGFLILIACFNFINLTTARAHERAKEVGLRKALGAEKKSLIFQFLTESSIISVISLVIAIGLVFIFLPTFNTIAIKNISILKPDSFLYIGVILLTAIVGLVAGSYPAFYLSSLVPVKVLKGNFNTSNAGTLLRKTLVVFQFAIAVGMIICAGVVYSQLKFWQHKNLGFDKEHLVNIPVGGMKSGAAEAFRTTLLQRTDVKGATLNNMMLGQGIFSNNPVANEGADSKESFAAGIIQSDFDLIKTLKLKLISGRDFNPQMSTDSSDAFIVNEIAAQRFGYTSETILGKRIEWRPGSRVFHGTVVGVVSNFNVQNLKEAVDPVLYKIRNRDVGNLTVRLMPGDHLAQLKEFEQLFNSFAPDLLFDHSFVDQIIEDEYKGENTLGKLFGIFAGLTILIACIGLLGLSILIARQRTREIGIRKVLGASIANISVLLTKDFLKLVLIGGICGLPFAYFGMNKWLEHFAFRISVEWWLMLMAVALVILIAIAAISTQAIKAALANPVKSLKSE